MARSYTIDLDETTDCDTAKTTATWAGDGKIQASGTSTDFYISAFSFDYSGSKNIILIDSKNEYNFSVFHFEYKDGTVGMATITINDPNKDKRDEYSINDEIEYYASHDEDTDLAKVWGGYVTSIEANDNYNTVVTIKGEGYESKWRDTKPSETEYPTLTITEYDEIIGDIMDMTGFTTDIEEDTDEPVSITLGGYSVKKAIDAISEARGKRAWITPAKVMRWKSLLNLDSSGIDFDMDTDQNIKEIRRIEDRFDLVNYIIVYGQTNSITLTDDASIILYGQRYTPLYAPHLDDLGDLGDYGNEILEDSGSTRKTYFMRGSANEDLIDIRLHDKITATATTMGLSLENMEILKIAYDYGRDGEDGNELSKRLMVSMEVSELGIL